MSSLIPQYYKVDFAIKGKHFPSVVKFHEGDRHWTLVYINPDNKFDWLIRKEIISQDLLRHGEVIHREVFEHFLNTVLAQLYENISDHSIRNNRTVL